ncbi:MAG: VWA domain-containing protein [Candidatus Melainabacteria bacterium]|nr:VWA domain-containing protein [Candidatus Melainabacteria bacterium]
MSIKNITVPNRKVSKVLLFSLLLALFSTQLFSASFGEQSSIQKGRELFGKGKFTEALNFFDQGVDEKPTEGAPHFWRAKCLSSLDRGKEAIAEYKLALLLSTDKATKEACRAELKKNNESIPVGSVVSESDAIDADGKIFKLSTKKLDWNLTVDDNLKSSLTAQDAQLAAAVNGSGMSSLDRMTREPFYGGAATRDKIALEIEKSVPHAAFQLSAADLQTFKASDVYIILDHSGSMESRDCPAGGTIQSRLNWSAEELIGFSETLSRSLPHGFVFIPFNSSPQAFMVKDSQSFSSLLRGLKWQGGTQLSPALKLAFQMHERHLNQPLLIAIITDGLINISDVKHTISAATRKFRLPNGVFVTFAQVGVSVDTTLLQEGGVRSSPALDSISNGLDEMNNLHHNFGAAYKACSVVRFRKLREDGLGRSILRALRAYVPAPSEQGKAETKKIEKKK